MKKTLKILILSIIFGALLVSCSLQKPSIIGNANVINEITRVEQLSLPDDKGHSSITVKDLQKLESLIKGDKIAEDYVKELKWLVGHNESLHLLHTTLFMRDYINTGNDTPCVPHDLWHISLFIKHGDIDYAKRQLKSIEAGYDDWVKSAEEKRKDYPQFYNSLEELEQMSIESIKRLKQNDYSEKTLEQLDLIGASELC